MRNSSALFSPTPTGFHSFPSARRSSFLPSHSTSFSSFALYHLLLLIFNSSAIFSGPGPPGFHGFFGLSLSLSLLRPIFGSVARRVTPFPVMAFRGKHPESRRNRFPKDIARSGVWAGGMHLFLVRPGRDDPLDPFELGTQLQQVLHLMSREKVSC